MEAIYLIKNDQINHQQTKEKLAKGVQNLQAQGCRDIILGCTELPLLKEHLTQQTTKLAPPDIAFTTINFINPNAIVAKAVVKMAQNIQNKTNEKNNKDKKYQINY